VSALGWGPDGRRLASGDEVGHLRIWDADTGDYLLALETTAWEGGQINSIAWSPDGERLHAATYYESVIWESRLETAQAVWRANGLRRAAELEEERLEAFVRDLFQKHVFLEPVLEALRTDKRLDAEDREAAIALAEWDGGPSAWRLNDLAWDLVDPEREDPATDVAAALEYARAAVDLEPGEPMYLDTLAWALFANGLDAEALEASVLALQHASEEDRGEYGGYLDQLEEALEDRAADPSAGDTNN